MQLFVDMDGVLADFDSGYEREFGVRPSKGTDNVDWKRVAQRRDFYRDLPPMPDFLELWEGVAPYQPIILTGVPASVREASDNKRAWVDRHIGSFQRVIGCPSRDKCLHMTSPGDILIDDWDKYRDLWIARGGRWITHTSAIKSLTELREMMGNS